MTTTSPSLGLLVVGAGQAAVQFAASLRDAGYEPPITLVGDEPHLPYQRPPLSKTYLKGAVDAASLALRSADFYEQARVNLISGERVVSVTTSAAGTGTATTSTGRILSFHRLVLATGAGPRYLGIPGEDAAGVCVLRGIDDAEALAEALPGKGSIVVVGGGFVGLEVAATARSLGHEVAVLEATPALLGRVVGTDTAELIRCAHRDAGIDIRLGTSATGILAEAGRATGVRLADGAVLPADVVLLSAGAVPRTELAEQLGLTCAGGIMVDAYSRTSDGLTLAIGDCAVMPDPSPHGDHTSVLRLESIDNAVEQAKAAVSTVMGEPRPYASMPWFWSDQGDLKLQIVGLRRPGDVAVVRRYDATCKQVVGYYREGLLVAAEALNAAGDFMQLKRAMSLGVQIDPTALTDPQVSLRDLVRAARS